MAATEKVARPRFILLMKIIAVILVVLVFAAAIAVPLTLHFTKDDSNTPTVTYPPVQTSSHATSTGPTDTAQTREYFNSG